MEPALDVMSRALQGDPEARSFLERTTTMYVLDASDTSNPKTYGCWNFIHQAMNEIERFEATHNPLSPSALVGHARLLSTMALRVARRSPTSDKALVSSCIAKEGRHSITSEQRQWLLDINFELREIVMGRIAAMAFDFSFHRSSVGAHGNSSFADHVVMDTLCAVLSANAVASGPPSILHFSTEWVIPSSRNLPTFSVASVVFHLATEGMKKLSPAGTKDTLQQLSNPIIVIVLVPSLMEVITNDDEGNSNHQRTPQERARIATMCLRALKAWCSATELSLPQINHVCLKVNLKIIDVLSDAMYSDCDSVVDALAEFIELTVPLSDEKAMSDGRMNQVRHLLQVEETAFQGRFSPDQLKTIEFREIGAIVEELVAAIGLQRYRFTERQNNGEHAVCRNLARIGAAVCTTFIEAPTEGSPKQLDSGPLTLLVKAASHPAISVCAIVLPVLSKCVKNTPALALELLPVLQRRAIIPHIFNNGTIAFSVPDFCDTNYSDFLRFRESVLTDTLNACWESQTRYYIDSCSSAVEEFCSERSTVGVSLQLEAALFCIEILSSRMMKRTDVDHSRNMSQVMSALIVKPASLMANSITRARACRLVRTYADWCVLASMDVVAADMCIACFLVIRDGAANMALSSDLEEFSPSSALEAAESMREFLTKRPLNFASESSAAALRACWDTALSSGTDSSKIGIKYEARRALGAGLMQVFHVMPAEHRPRLFEELVTSCMSRLQHASQILSNPQSPTFSSTQLLSLSDEIMLLSGLSYEFTCAQLENGDKMDSDKTPSLEPYVVIVLRRAIPAIRHSVRLVADDEKITAALKSFFSDLVPLCHSGNDIALIQDLSSILEDLFHRGDRSVCRFEAMFHFFEEMLQSFGTELELSARPAAVEPETLEIGTLLKEKIVYGTGLANPNLGSVWSSPPEQNRGQPPFESKPPVVPKTSDGHDDTLLFVLNLLTRGLETCPSFVWHLPSEVGKEQEDESLIRRSVDTSCASLLSEDSGLIKHSIRFLQALMNLSSTVDDELSPLVNESIARVRGGIIGGLFAGTCGKYDSSMLPETADLLLKTLKACPEGEIESHLVAALRQDYFLCGDDAKNALLSHLRKCAREGWTPGSLNGILEELWVLHQAEDTDALRVSDAVYKFVTKFSKT